MEISLIKKVYIKSLEGKRKDAGVKEWVGWLVGNEEAIRIIYIVSYWFRPSRFHLITLRSVWNTLLTLRRVAFNYLILFDFIIF